MTTFNLKEVLLKLVTKIRPSDATGHNKLGVIYYNSQKFSKAINCYKRALEIDPNHLSANINLGIVYQNLGEFYKAIDCFKKTIEIDSNNIVTLINLGNLFFKIDELHSAINCYEKALEIDPKNLDSYNNLGAVFIELGEYEKAKKVFKKIIELNSNYIMSYNNLGSIYNKLGEPDEAINIYKKVLELDPNFISAQKRIALTYVRKLDLDNAVSASYKSLKMHNSNLKFINKSIPLFRLKHDVQQAKYLSSKNYNVDGIDKFQKIGSEILYRKENKENKNNFNKKILLNESEINALLPFYKSNLIYKPKVLSQNYINPNKNWLEVEKEYFNNSKQIIFIDDFLSEETAKELREFCLISKVWHKEYYNPFLGAFADNGFISQIHLQIAKDLQIKLPKLFGPHNLGTLWGYKYDSTLGKGINVHADFAIHNLNFWITPDEFNNNKKSGGLKVYDVPAPNNWTYKDYNAKTDKIYKFLKDNNANFTNVPYKFNRAVLFNSAYFHETDEIDFKDEYEGRRINMTYLFGRRLVKSKN